MGDGVSNCLYCERGYENHEYYCTGRCKSPPDCECGLMEADECDCHETVNEGVVKACMCGRMVASDCDCSTFSRPSSDYFTTNSTSMTDYTKTQVKQISYKYSEDKILADLKKYLDNTYGEHYNTDDGDIQCFDAWIALGDATPTFRNTALKYLWRYGKKDGSNKKDLMKVLHYVVLMLHNDHYKGK